VLRLELYDDIQALKLGDRVRIEGLQSSEQLAFNGLQGYVWELSPDAAYARITLLTGKNLSLKVRMYKRSYVSQP
jgi:hypothetical protein